VAQHFHLTAKDVLSTRHDALVSVCGRGDLEMLKWLAARFFLTEPVLREKDDEALRLAAGIGHHDVVGWLAEKYKKPLDRWRGAQALSPALENGHLEIAQTMVDKKIVSIDGQDSFSRQLIVAALFKPACKAGRLAAAEWVADRFGLGAGDVSDPLIMLSALASGRPEVVQWLTGRFGLAPPSRLLAPL